MSTPQPSKEDLIRVLGSLTDFELVEPKAQNQDGTVYAGFNVSSSRFKSHENYLAKVQALLDNNAPTANQTHNPFGITFKHVEKKSVPELINGVPVYLDYSSMDMRDINNSLHQFGKINQKDKSNLFFFDIETIGASTTRGIKGGGLDNYSLSEFSAINYNKDGSINKKNSLNLLMRIDENTKDKVVELLNTVNKDRYKFYSMKESEQRQIIDLMRYSTIQESGYSNFSKQQNGMLGKVGNEAVYNMNITHNSLIEDRFTNQFGKIDYDMVLREWDKSYLHMKDGLRTLTSKDLNTQSAGAGVIEKYLKDHQKGMFVSYNGYEFDKPLVKDFIVKEAMNRENHLRSAQGKDLVSYEEMVKEREKFFGRVKGVMDNHLDLYRLIESTYGTVGELEKTLAGENRNRLTNKQLQTIRELLPADARKALEDLGGLAHSAEADNHVLAQVFDALSGDIQERIKKGNKAPGQMQQVDSRNFSRGKEKLTYGMKLVSNQALVTTDEWDPYSFVKTAQGINRDEKGKAYTTYGLADASNGRVILRRESLYEFRGIEQIKNIDGQQAYRAQFYNVLEDEHAYVVRTGHNAQAELTTFINQQFTSEKYTGFDRFGDKDNPLSLYRMTKEQLYDDRATRFYSSMFATDNYTGGLWIDKNTGDMKRSGAKGFTSVQLNAQATELYRAFLEERDANILSRDPITGTVTYKEGYDRKAAGLKIRSEVESVFDNIKHSDNFFRIKGRLLDEMPLYSEAIQSIEAKYTKEIANIHTQALEELYERQGGDRTWKGEASYKSINKDYIYKLKEIQQKQNMAISFFHQQVERLMEKNEQAFADNRRKVRPLKERWEVRFTDVQRNNNVLINFADYQSSKRSILSYIKQTTHKTESSLPGIRRERYDELIGILHRENILSDKAFSNLKQFANIKGTAAGTTYANAIYETVTREQQRTISQVRKKNPNLSYEEVMEKAFERSGLTRVTEQDALNLEGNKSLKKFLTPDVQQQFIENAIEQTDNFIPTMSDITQGNSNTKEIQLPEAMRNYLASLDRDRHLSILKSDNVGAAEKVLNSMRQKLGGDHSIFVSLEKDAQGRYTGINFMATNSERGSSAFNTLNRGELPNGMLRFTMPLINESGFMRVGNLNMNANMVADLQDIGGKKQAVLISTQDAVADIIVSKINTARKYIDEPDLINATSGYQKASEFLNKRVTEYMGTLSGSDKDSKVQGGDTAKVQGSLMDWRKQQHVLFEDAYVKDLINRGFNGFKITDKDLRESAFHLEDGIKNRNDYLTIHDLNEKAKMKAIGLRAAWWEANRSGEYENIFLTLGSVKSSNSDKFLSGMDNQAYMPMGMFHDTVRDPMSQAFGAELLDKNLRNRISGIRGVQTELSYMSAMQFELAKTFANKQGELMIPDMIQIKTAYMTNDDIKIRVGNLLEDDYARSVFQREKIFQEIDNAEKDRIMNSIKNNARSKGIDLANLTEEQIFWQEAYVKKVGDKYLKVDVLKLPNTYEQQSAVDKDFLDAMKLKNSRRYASNHIIEFDKNFLEEQAMKLNTTVDKLDLSQVELEAGKEFGKIIYANGSEDIMEYNGKGIGRIGGILRNDDGSIRELKTLWEEDSFKAFTFAEKSTMQGVNRDIISLITSNEDVVMIHAGEVYKHKEHGHFLARLQAELSMDIKQSAGPERAAKIKAIEDAKLGLAWDNQFGVLVDDTYVKPSGYRGGQNEFSIIKRGGDSLEYSLAMESLVQSKDENGQYIFKGFEKKFEETISTGIEQFRLASITNSAKQVDDKNKKFLGYKEVWNDELQQNVMEKVYSNQLKDGVNIGHREIRTMRSQGMVETMAHIQRQMLASSQKQLELSGMRDLEGYSGIKYNHKITLAQELDNMITSVEMAVDAGARPDEFAISRRIQDFAHRLPTKNYDPGMYHHTIFDMNTILEESLQERAAEKGRQLYGEGFSQDNTEFNRLYNEVKAAHENAEIGSSDRIRGFWLELPTAVTDTGTEISPVLKDKSRFENGESEVAKSRKMADKETNRIFVPLMHATQDKGNRYLNEIQRHVRAIVERAEQATSADSFEKRTGHVRELSDMISNYYSTVVKDVSSSNGYVKQNLNQYEAENSASGLYKLMNAEQSNAFQNQYDYKGEFTVMNEKDALAMGLSKAEIGDIKANNKEMFVGQIRYPSFHDGAVQYNRLFIGDDSQVRVGEFRTSTFSSILKNADSDGDNSFMFLIRNESVQQEMKGFQSKRIEKYSDAFDKYMKEKGNSDEAVRNMMMNGGDHIRSLLGDQILDVRHANQSDEVVAKVWKGIVGQVSNLNYDMQQLASDMLERGEIDQGEYARTIKFGQLLEQKIIDSKHGAEGVSSQIIQSIKRGNWTEAETLMRQHYAAKDKLTDQTKMLSIYDGDKLIRTVNESIFDESNAFDTARQVILRSTTHYQTEQGKLNIAGLDYGKSSGFRGTLEEFAEISRNSELAQSSGMMTRHNTYLNLLYGHLGIDQEALRTSAQMQADAAAVDLRNSKVTVNGMTAQIASDRERRLLQSVSANPIMDLMDPSIASGAGRSKMLAGGAIAVGALVGYNVLIGNSKPPAYNHENSQQFKRQYTSEEIYAEPSTQSRNAAGMMAELTDHSYNDRQFEGHKAESAAAGRGEEYAQQQFASVMIQAKGSSRIDDGVTSLVNQAMVGSGMVTGATNIRLTTTDNTRNLDRIWYRDQVENQL